MKDYAVRIARSFSELIGFFDELTAHNIKFIVYEHHKDMGCARTHIHALLFAVKQSTDTLKNWVKTALGLSLKDNLGNSGWSFKLAYNDPAHNNTFDYEHNVTYMSKGCLEPKRNTAYSNDQVVLARSKWVPRVTNVTVAGKSEVVVISVQKKTKNEIMGEVANKLRNEEGNLMPSDKKIIKAVCDVLRDNRIITNMYKMADYVDSYKTWYHGDEFVDILEKYYVTSRYR